MSWLRARQVLLSWLLIYVFRLRSQVLCHYPYNWNPVKSTQGLGKKLFARHSTEALRAVRTQAPPRLGARG